MPPKRTRKAEDSDDAPVVAPPAKRAKVDTDTKKALPVRKAPTKANTAATAEKPAAKAKAPPKKAAAAKASPKPAAAKKAASRQSSTSASPVPATNGAVVKPTAKDAKAAAPLPKLVKIDPLDLAYAEPNPGYKNLPTKKPINAITHTKPLDIFVCGEGSSGELGLGTARKQMDVKRPRLNANISGKNIVRVAAGGMHVLALTAEGDIYSWGVNDQGALGRDTRWDGGLKDMDSGDSSDSEDDDDDSGMNPHEANPVAIKSTFFHPNSTIIDIVAGDSCSFALTAEGRVYGWGTFRSNEGILGFSKESDIQRTPILLKSLKNITQLAAGDNHVLALDDKGSVWAWGSGQQSQLGRRIIERTKKEGLTPAPAVIKRQDKARSIKIAEISCGAYCSYAIDKDGNLWSWGANNYGETGHFDNAGEDNAITLWPSLVEDPKDEGKPLQVKFIDGGAHHTVAISNKGEALVWGRCDGGQTGIKVTDLNQNDVITGSGETVTEVLKKGGQLAPKDYKLLAMPTAIPAIGTDAVYAACGTDHTIIVTKQGKAWTSGFSSNYQTGQGTIDDVNEMTMIDNTATRNRKIVWAGAGGQYSIFAAEKDVANDIKINGA